MTKAHIITIFDQNYLARVMAFRESLDKQAPELHVWFLALDDKAYEMSKKLQLKNTTVMKVSDMNDRELEQTRANRSLPAFASTCKPAFMSYMMQSGIVGPDDLLVFIDPDFYFYASPKDLFKKVYDSGSITITPHRFPPNRENEKYQKGYYNAGIICMKNDSEALKCLGEWRVQCIEWCHIRFEDGKIGDQGYLSDWPKKYKGVYELTDRGVNVSTWNIENHKITSDGQDGFLIGGEPLICYHFHGQRIYMGRDKKIYTAPSTSYHRGIYKVHEKALTLAYEQIWQIDPSWKLGLIPNPGFLRLLKQRVWKIFS